MNANFDQVRVELDRALFLRLADAKGSTVVCLEGCLWVTRDGCAKDIQLAPGESYHLEDATPVIVTGFGPSLARLLKPAAERRPWARRWLGALAPRRVSGLATA
jgi:hypothetical protein